MTEFKTLFSSKFLVVLLLKNIWTPTSLLERQQFHISTTDWSVVVITNYSQIVLDTGYSTIRYEECPENEDISSDNAYDALREFTLSAIPFEAHVHLRPWELIILCFRVDTDQHFSVSKVFRVVLLTCIPISKALDSKVCIFMEKFSN